LLILQQYIRRIELQPVGLVEHLGIKAQRYQMDNATWMQRPEYFQFIEGFANLTGKQKSPVFVSNPHMCLAEEQWSNQIDGIRGPGNNSVKQTTDTQTQYST
jgi:hypothetical protein